MIPKSDNSKTSILQCYCSDDVFLHTFLMLTAINFNNDLFFKAYEIENVIFKRVLSAKFQTFNLPAS